MGPLSSAANAYPQAFAYIPPDEYVPMSGYRPDNKDDSIVTHQPVTNCSLVHNPTLLKGWVHAIWSLLPTNGLGPCPRSSHFEAYDAEHEILYIGYGLNKENQPLNDIWKYDFHVKSWAQLPVNGFDIMPRSGSRATLMKNYLVIFGGYNTGTKEYIADLHIINLDTYEILRPEFSGPVPAPRSSPLVTSYEDKIIIWGGYNGKFLSELNILNTTEKTWSFIEKDVKGRTGFPHVQDGKMIYIQGGATDENAVLMTLDLETLEIGGFMPKGQPVNSKLIGSSMVKTGPVLLLIGGRSNAQYTHVYAYHLERQTWMYFHIAPDGETVSTVDGDVDDNGLFMLPRTQNTSLVYREEERSVFGFLGAPLMDPPMIHKLCVGPSLAVINLQDDMLRMI
ncbi:Kelch motif family protein [Trichomonas vaginalis G3]|uniref:Kelch motif family protein n=1 Tax=Trichomonas vaginalis (strain ATCC PRA-98 / G3) TaxID=412133 RepID=A2FB02_TRIV3|nr:nitrile biosynthetic process [Trichomonas vaginalis G3]XP_051105964.1 nitrile biosynthetic process [Trichomonas vaginalis G3]EAX97930.1 Kelch motif family protein [Trichomonas vaginalis G3]KAI5541294.1 nitrile biosynthetic process [Trichomonas vaginalis G3]KAI5541313.1 nitrile biosynthetic process [Trichomonas vaginalis G3]|eukprot:XP_001310860.1 Kelch motif family protein [Trichomonas vaginalis G3]